MPSDTRERMIQAAAESFRRRGLAGTSFTDVLAASGAARGAIYHHFPDGKAQLAREAVSWFGAGVTARLAALGDVGDDDLATPAQVVDRFLTLVRPVVGESAECMSCPVAAVTLESTRGEGHLLAAADDAFAAWAAELARLLITCRAGAGRGPGARGADGDDAGGSAGAVPRGGFARAIRPRCGRAATSPALDR